VDIISCHKNVLAISEGMSVVQGIKIRPFPQKTQGQHFNHFNSITKNSAKKENL